MSKVLRKYQPYRQLENVCHTMMWHKVKVLAIYCLNFSFLHVCKHVCLSVICDNLKSLHKFKLCHILSHCKICITGAILLANWMQSTHRVDGTMVTRQLDEIAVAVGTHLLQARGVTGSYDILSAVKELLLSSSVILEAINNVLYNEMKFTGNGDDYYNPNNSYINKVYVC